MNLLRSHRKTLGLSQLRLARLSGVSRFKIAVFELGDGELTPEEQKCIHAALLVEVDRLRNLPTMNLGEKAGEEATGALALV